MDAQGTGIGVWPENGAPEAGDSLAARLGELGRRVPPPFIGDVWLFPPLPEIEASSDFVLFTRILEDDGRALYSARMVPANGRPSHQIVVEHGRAPADRVPKLVSGLQRRLGGGAARHIAIGGDGERWRELLERVRGESGSDGSRPAPVVGESGSDGSRPAPVVGESGSDGSRPAPVRGESGSD